MIGWRPVGAAATVLALLVAACGPNPAVSSRGAGEKPTLLIGGIPDQDVHVLEERFGGVADYLESEVGIPVDYRPSTSYAALVTAFDNGDVLLGWFGGLTGVQARQAVPDAHAVVQRPRDAEFHSVFVVHAAVQADSLEDLKGVTFTFGSESSTSGHLMPRHFLAQAGVDPEEDFDGRPSYSGSHDKTWKLVEAGSFQAGALNEAVWEDAVASGEVDTTRVRVIETTPPYHDYHWVAHPRIDEVYGAGTTDRIVQALLDMDASDTETARTTLELFQTDEFVETDDDRYATVAAVARDLGLVRP
jgi:phosphonate transport system substrate-binding protein